MDELALTDDGGDTATPALVSFRRGGRGGEEPRDDGEDGEKRRLISSLGWATLPGRRVGMSLEPLF